MKPRTRPSRLFPAGIRRTTLIRMLRGEARFAANDEPDSPGVRLFASGGPELLRDASAPAELDHDKINPPKGNSE